MLSVRGTYARREAHISSGHCQCSAAHAQSQESMCADEVASRPAGCEYKVAPRRLGGALHSVAFWTRNQALDASPRWAPVRV